MTETVISFASGTVSAVLTYVGLCALYEYFDKIHPQEFERKLKYACVVSLGGGVAGVVATWLRIFVSRHFVFM